MGLELGLERGVHEHHLRPLLALPPALPTTISFLPIRIPALLSLASVSSTLLGCPLAAVAAASMQADQTTALCTWAGVEGTQVGEGAKCGHFVDQVVSWSLDRP